jgi:uncharacterized protein YdcH (DUF465 family)
MFSPIDSQIREAVDKKIVAIEQHFNADVIFFYGPIGSGLPNEFREMIDELKKADKGYKRLCIVLTTSGGSANEVERCVNVIRNYYDEIYFIIPDYAYSAGTIFCMSGDNIYMNFYSVLGPIDPQVQNKDGHWVAALGYLDKVNDMIARSKTNDLSPAEFLILKEMDLGELREYEQAKELTIDLLKTWLVKYKFKSWTKHKTNPKKLGKLVTIEEKKQRASEIANMLSNNNRWKAHGRPINIDILQNELRLEINDFSIDKRLEDDILSYYAYIMDYIRKMRYYYCFHTRRRAIEGG